MKTCNRCGVEKPHGDFYKKKAVKSGLSSWCKECTKENNRNIYATPEGKERLLWNAKRSRYGIDKGIFTSLLEQQNGVCAICGSGFNDKCCIDHNHETGEVRGLLCDACNRGIGLLKDSVLILTNAANYLKQNGSYERSNQGSPQTTP